MIFSPIEKARIQNGDLWGEASGGVYDSFHRHSKIQGKSACLKILKKINFNMSNFKISRFLVNVLNW